MIFGIDQDLFTENVLQLVIVEPSHVIPRKMKLILDKFKYFRVFILSFKNDDAEEKLECFQQIRTLDWVLGSNSLTLHYSVGADDSFYIDGINDMDDIIRKLSERMRPQPNENAIIVRNQRICLDNFNLFDHTFGQRDEILKTPILIYSQAHHSKLGMLFEFQINPRLKLFTFYYYSALKAKYVEVAAQMFDDERLPVIFASLLPGTGKYYKEVLQNYQIL